jgi:hypothetical protein
MLCEFDEWKILVAIDLDQGEIGLGISADHFCGVDCAVVGRDLDGCSVIDHVVVGHRITVCSDEEAGAFASNGVVSPWRVRPELPAELLTKLVAELLKKFIQRRAGLNRDLLVVIVAVVLQ